MKDRSDRLGTIALIAYMLCACVCLCAIFLTTLGLNDNVYRLIHELLTDHRTASCSFLLYVTLNAALIVRAWAAYKNHHNIRWFNFVNIGLASGAYGTCAYFLNVNGHSILMDAALNPLFWMIDNIAGVLLCTAAIIGFGAVGYFLLYWGPTRFMRRERCKRLPSEREIKRFARKLNTVKSPKHHPEFRKTCNRLQKEQNKINADRTEN